MRLDDLGTTNKLLRNTIAIIIAKGIQPLFSTVLVFLIIRIWSPEDFGKYTTLFDLLAIFQVLCGFGLRSTLTREVAKNKDSVHQYISNGIIVAIPFSILSMLFMIGVVHILQYKSYLILNSNILSISLIASALGECFEGILTGFERIRSIAIIWIIETVFKTGISIILVYSGFGLLSIVVTFIIIRFFNPIACFFVIRRSIGKPKFNMNIGFIKGLIKITYIVAIIEIVATIYWRIDTVILQRMRGNVDAGLFGAVHKIFSFNQMLITTFFIAFLPVMSRLFSGGRETFQRACNQSLQYLCIINLAVALFVTVYSKNIVLLLCGNDYLEAAPALVIFIWAIFFFAINELLGYVLFVSNNQKIDLKIHFFGLLLKISSNYILINKYGYIGAAIATLSSLLVMLGLKYRCVVKYVMTFPLRKLSIKTIKLSIAGSIMILLVYLFRENNMFVVFILSFFVYLISLLILKMFSEDDISHFRKWIHVYIMRKKSITY